MKNQIVEYVLKNRLIEFEEVDEYIRDMRWLAKGGLCIEMKDQEMRSRLLQSDLCNKYYSIFHNLRQKKETIRGEEAISKLMTGLRELLPCIECL